MVAHYSAGATAERGAVAQYLWKPPGAAAGGHRGQCIVSPPSSASSRSASSASASAMPRYCANVASTTERTASRNAAEGAQGLNRAFGALCLVLEEERPGTAARLLAALEEAADDPAESYSERVTEKMRSMLGCIQEFLLDIGNFRSPRIARVRPSQRTYPPGRNLRFNLALFRRAAAAWFTRTAPLAPLARAWPPRCGDHRVACS